MECKSLACEDLRCTFSTSKSPWSQSDLEGARNRPSGARSKSSWSTVDKKMKSLHRIVNENKPHPFRNTRVQHLQSEDYPAWQNFWRWLLDEEQLESNFVINIFFSDKSVFVLQAFLKKNDLTNMQTVSFFLMVFLLCIAVVNVVESNDVLKFRQLLA